MVKGFQGSTSSIINKLKNPKFEEEPEKKTSKNSRRDASTDWVDHHYLNASICVNIQSVLKVDPIRFGHNIFFQKWLFLMAQKTCKDLGLLYKCFLESFPVKANLLLKRPNPDSLAYAILEKCYEHHYLRIHRVRDLVRMRFNFDFPEQIKPAVQAFVKLGRAFGFRFQASKKGKVRSESTYSRIHLSAQVGEGLAVEAQFGTEALTKLCESNCQLLPRHPLFQGISDNFHGFAYKLFLLKFIVPAQSSIKHRRIVEQSKMPAFMQAYNKAMAKACKEGIRYADFEEDYTHLGRMAHKLILRLIPLLEAPKELKLENNPPLLEDLKATLHALWQQKKTIAYFYLFFELKTIIFKQASKSYSVFPSPGPLEYLYEGGPANNYLDRHVALFFAQDYIELTTYHSGPGHLYIIQDKTRWGRNEIRVWGEKISCSSAEEKSEPLGVIEIQNQTVLKAVSYEKGPANISTERALNLQSLQFLLDRLVQCLIKFLPQRPSEASQLMMWKSFDLCDYESMHTARKTGLFFCPKALSASRSAYIRDKAILLNHEEAEAGGISFRGP